MGMFSFFKKEEREFKPINEGKNSLSAVLEGDFEDQAVITREMAIEIPSLKAGIGFISDLVAGLEIKYYKDLDGRVESVEDYRLKLLNEETGDLLNSFQMKQAMMKDFLLSGNAYIYVKRDRNKIKSLHYVDTSYVGIIPNHDPIFKDGKITVNGAIYDPYEFVIFAQNTKNGLEGKGILKENSSLLELSYETLAFANGNIAAGGIKRGVVKSQKRLTEQAMTALKEAWRSLYDKNTSRNSSVIILNEGLEFQELSQTSAELEILDSRKHNDSDILRIIKIPAGVLDGTATDEQYNNFIKSTIIPILEQLSIAFNKTLLLETEKAAGCFFAFDTKDLLKGNVKERFDTYKTAIESGLMTPNECRYQENLDALEGMDIVKMSLGHVIYDTKTKNIYTPNTGQVIKNGEISSPDDGKGVI